MEIKKWKRVGLGAVTLLSTVVLAACGNSSSSSASSSDEINWFIPTEISTLDISKVTDTYSSIAIGNSGSNLLRRDEDGELQPDLAEYVSPGYSYDEEAAAKLFKEGLAELGTDSVTLTITADSDAPVAKAAVDYIKETWENTLSGLTVEEKFVTFKQRLEDTKNQNFDVALVLWGGDYPEGSTFYGLFTTNSSYNYGKFSNADYDAAYQKAITTDALDPAAAADDYKAAEKALYDNALYNPIYFRSGKGLQNPDLKGLVRSSTGLSVDFTYAYKE